MDTAMEGKFRTWVMWNYFMASINVHVCENNNSYRCTDSERER